MKNTKEIIGFDAVKVQTEIMKNIITNAPRLMAGEVSVDEGSCFFVSNANGTLFYLIPELFCFVNKEKLYEKYTQSIEATKRVVDGACNAKQTGYMLKATGAKYSTDKKTQAVEFEMGDKLVYFDEKLLNNFENVTLYSTGPYDIAAVYAGEMLVGGICPMKFSK